MRDFVEGGRGVYIGIMRMWACEHVARAGKLTKVEEGCER